MVVFREISSVVGYRPTRRVVGFRKRTMVVASDRQLSWVTVVGFRKKTESDRGQTKKIVMGTPWKTSGEVQVENERQTESNSSGL